jgi:NAD(P)-dependent dehydrogenase (short-subunit alcohol dehydrogenase family)
MNALRFDGRVAVITGAGRGLGREYAKLLAARGAAVVVNDLGVEPDGTGTSASPAADVVKEIIAAGGRAVASSATAATAEGAAQTIEIAVQTFGSVDIVINNAGVIMPGSFSGTTPELFERLLAVNLFSVVHMSQAAWPHLQKSQGNVVNTSSGGILGVEQLAAYGASKGAIFALTRAMALSGAKHGIRVNNILPIGATRMIDHSGYGVPPEEARKVMEVEQAPRKVAPVAAFLAHKDCPVSGKSFSAGMNRMSLVFVGETRGYRSPTFSLEEIAKHFGEVVSKDVVNDFADCDDMLAYVMSLPPMS